MSTLTEYDYTPAKSLAEILLNLESLLDKQRQCIQSIQKSLSNNEEIGSESDYEFLGIGA